ncbi:MAG TPA: hypothetical protein DEA08_00320, partial [Planctomycetes bacterium]|nr:hypothetical protein [Planctomycetota bacterium]
SAIERGLSRQALAQRVEPLLRASDPALRLEGARLLLRAGWRERARPLLAALAAEEGLVAAEAALTLHVLSLEAAAPGAWPEDFAPRGAAGPALSGYAAALAARRQGEEERALRELERLAPRARWHFPLLQLRARLRRARGDLTRAASDARTAAELAPGSFAVGPWLEVVEVAASRGDLRAAEDARERALLASPVAGRLARLGRARFSATSFSEAAGLFRRALELDPRLRFLEIDLAQTLGRAEEEGEARALLRRQVERPAPARALCALAELELYGDRLEA